MAHKRKKYGAEFRAEAVRLVRSSNRPVVQIAAELGVPHSTLHQWVMDAEKKEAQPDALAESERAELQRLRREVERLRMEREILKKAAAFFAKENS